MESRESESGGSNRGVPVGQCIQLQNSSYSEDPVFLPKNDFQEGFQTDQWCGFADIYGKSSQPEEVTGIY